MRSCFENHRRQRAGDLDSLLAVSNSFSPGGFVKLCDESLERGRYRSTGGKMDVPAGM